MKINWLQQPRIFYAILSLFLCLLIVMLQGISVFAEYDALSKQTPFYDPDVKLNSCKGSTISLAGSENAEKAFNFFVTTAGYKPWQAAGIVGNMTIESSILPQRLQGTTPDVITPASDVGDRDIGWGIVQWTPGSKMIGPVQNDGKDPNDLGVQLEFLWNQLEGKGPIPEKRAGDDIKSTGTVEDAVLAFQGNANVGGKYPGFERPADESGSVADRTAAARDALTRFGSGTNSSSSSSAPTAAKSGCFSSSDGTLPSGTAQELAKQILNNPSVTFTTAEAKQSIVDTAEGQPAQVPCIGSTTPLSPVLLGVILKVAEQHKVAYGYITNACHAANSAHYTGRAADINTIDGRTALGTASDRAFMQYLTGILPDGSGMGEVQCGGDTINPIHKVNLFEDSCDHIHIQVP